MVFLVPVALTVGRLAFTAMRFGAKAVIKNPIKTGIAGAVVVNQDEIGQAIDEVQEKSSLIKVAGYGLGAFGVYKIYKKVKK